MRIVLISPFSQGPIRGNQTTVDRIALQLTRADVDVTIRAADSSVVTEPDHSAAPPTLLHAFHAYHSGALARRLAHHYAIPYLVTITGSDLFDPAFRDHPLTRAVLQDAAAITCFDQVVAEQLQAQFQDCADKLAIIPQGVSVPRQDETPVARPADALVVLLPAALRPAKGILEAIEWLSPLAAGGMPLQLWLVGGDLDPAYAAAVRQQGKLYDWIVFWGEIPHDQMGGYYAASDLVLNSSHFEGGMANALLEAMARGKAVLASDVPGNRSLILHNHTGLLYHTAQELREHLQTLARQPELRSRLGQAARKLVVERFSPEREADALTQLYHRINTQRT